MFSLIVNYSSIRILLVVFFNELKLDQMDTKIVFLYDNLEEEIHMAQFEGFIKEGAENMVCC